MSSRPLPRRVSILGIEVDALDRDRLYEAVSQMIGRNRRHLVSYVNVHTLNVAYRDARLRELYRRSDLVYCDGAGVILAGRVLGWLIPARLTGASFVPEFAPRWEKDATSLFFLGGRPGIAEEACRKLRVRYPCLRIVGYHHGCFQRGSAEESQAVLRIARSAPDILFVGLGTPLQEHWVLDNMQRLEARVIWPIGALVDYLSGMVPRCPQWMQRHGLEWLYRLALEPRRMFGRYVIGNPVFLARVLRERFSRR